MRTRALILLALGFSTTLLGQSPTLDQYGGRTDIKCANSTEWFHTEKLGDRWWFCTPLGNAFFMEGVYVVAPSDNGFQNAVKRKYGDANAAWAEETKKRLQSWGFNTLGIYSSISTLPIDPDTSYGHPTKMPFVTTVRPALYSMTNPFINTFQGQKKQLLDDPVKNIFYGVGPFYGGFRPSTGVADYFDPKLELWLSRHLSQAQFLNSLKTSRSLSYLLGIGTDDGDQMFGFGAGDAFPTIPSGHNNPHLSWIIATTSPTITFSEQFRVLYQNTSVFSKNAFKEMLKAKYGTITALNAKWESSYTTFDSSGATVSDELIGTGDGATTTFTHVLEHAPVAPLSVVLIVNGKRQAGDCPFWVSSCEATAGGSLEGPLDATVGTRVQPWLRDPEVVQCACALPAASYLVRITYHFPEGSGMVSSASRRVGATVEAGKRIQVTSPAPDPSHKAIGYDVYVATAPPGQHATDPETLQASNIPFGSSWLEPVTGIVRGEALPSPASTIDYSSGKIHVSFAKPPVHGSLITVTYAYNGWMSGGTGLMDEDGRTEHQIWLGKDFTYLSDTNPNVKIDLDAFLYATASQYLRTCRAEIKKAFPNILFLGPDAIGSWGAPARADVLKAAGEYLDVLSGPGHLGDRHAAIDYVAQYFGDKPILEGQYLEANPDSPFSNYRSNSDFASQQERGQGYYEAVTALRNLTSSATGSHPFIGEAWWQYTDNRSELKNWGLVTLLDNAYDGHEDVPGEVPCSSPLERYRCGGETQGYGDVLTLVKKANRYWLEPRPK